MSKQDNRDLTRKRASIFHLLNGPTRGANLPAAPATSTDSSLPLAQRRKRLQEDRDDEHDREPADQKARELGVAEGQPRRVVEVGVGSVPWRAAIECPETNIDGHVHSHIRTFQIDPADVHAGNALARLPLSPGSQAFGAPPVVKSTTATATKANPSRPGITSPPFITASQRTRLHSMHDRTGDASEKTNYPHSFTSLNDCQGLAGSYSAQGPYGAAHVRDTLGSELPKAEDQENNNADRQTPSMRFTHGSNESAQPLHTGSFDQDLSGKGRFQTPSDTGMDDADPSYRRRGNASSLRLQSRSFHPYAGSSVSSSRPSPRRVIHPESPLPAQASPLSGNFKMEPDQSRQHKWTRDSPSSISSAAADQTTRFQLFCRQQPLHARMCGFGEKDKRPLDPPPIVQCFMADAAGNRIEFPPKDPHLTVHATLWNEDGTDERNLIETSFPKKASVDCAKDDSASSAEPPKLKTKLSRVLMGSLVASPTLLDDEFGTPGSFYIFPDLSIRTEGSYRLKFTLFSMNVTDIMTPGTKFKLISECISDVFVVYSAKKFPGMRKSTELTKALAKQGFKIQVRNDARMKRRPEAEDEAADQPMASDRPYDPARPHAEPSQHHSAHHQHQQSSPHNTQHQMSMHMNPPFQVQQPSYFHPPSYPPSDRSRQNSVDPNYSFPPFPYGPFPPRP